MFPGSCLSDDKGKKSEKYRKHPVLAICVSGGTGGPVFMNKRRETVLKDERKKRKSIETEMEGKPYSRGFLCYGCGAVFAGSPYRKSRADP